ncbi:MAG: IS66 family transposase, partial [Gammaproteobacteria bacterium]|nr:IS66 family transposase [Gammaproteobacteria bacterium]
RSEKERYKAKLAFLEEQIRLMRHKQFGASSEKVTPQENLFNESELEPVEEEDVSAEVVTPTTAPAKKRTSGRKPLPAKLPRIRVEHDLTEEEKVCDCGCQMARIGEETSEQLEIIPAKVQVIQNVRFKYACKACEAGVRTTPLPPQPLPKSNASPGLLAYIIVAKFMDALPLHQERARPIIDKLYQWLLKSLPEVPPTSATGKALVYLKNQWPSLLHYLEEGRLNIDNNPAENAIRPFVLGRKSWIFADTPAGAHASAALYSLIESAKANDLEPYHYLRHVLKELPKAQSL